MELSHHVLKDFNKAGESVLAEMALAKEKSDAPLDKALAAFDTDFARSVKAERAARVEGFRQSVCDAFGRLSARVGLALGLWRLGRREKARSAINPKPRRQCAPG